MDFAYGCYIAIGALCITNCFCQTTRLNAPQQLFFVKTSVGSLEQESTIALHLFGQRIVSFKVPQNVDTLPSKYLDEHGDKRWYQLVTTKSHQPQTSITTP